MGHFIAQVVETKRIVVVLCAIFSICTARLDPATTPPMGWRSWNSLLNGINEKIIFGAGLDVFEKEPIDKNNPLINNKKVLLSPHSATFTNECKSRMAIETTKNIIDFFENTLDKSMIVKT